MIGRILGRINLASPSRLNFTRTLSLSYPLYNSNSPLSDSKSSSKSKSKKFNTPDEYVAKKQLENVEEYSYQQSLLGKEFEYNPKYISENKVNEITERPIPLNVELLNYQPLRLPKTHGHEVAELKFRSYNQENLTRASEFAARSAFYLGIPCNAIKPLKTEKRLYTVIRSPFAQAKSKENFHRVTYACKLKAFDANSEVLDLWLSFVNKYALEDVDYKTTIHTRESLDFSKELDGISSEDLKFSDSYKDLDDPIANKVEELLKSDTFKNYFDGKK